VQCSIALLGTVAALKNELSAMSAGCRPNMNSLYSLKVWLFTSGVKQVEVLFPTPLVDLAISIQHQFSKYSPLITTCHVDRIIKVGKDL